MLAESLVGRNAPSAHQRELSFIINSMLRLDDASAAPHLAVIVRAINTLLLTRRGSIQMVRFPNKGITYRGGGLPDQHRRFFQPDKKYRVPGFLATSFLRNVAENFMVWADMRGEPCVMWIVHVDPEGENSQAKRCMHVNYVERTAPGVPIEEEYLFAPYAPFTVKEVCSCSPPLASALENSAAAQASLTCFVICPPICLSHCRSRASVMRVL
jgi:hypothetical protein